MSQPKGKSKGGLGRGVILILLLTFVCCWAVGSIQLPAAELIGGKSEGLPSASQYGAAPPSGGSCANFNRDYPENPFRGWPVERFRGDWKVISSWFCDPAYFKGYTHWGIDLTSRVTADRWESIDHAEVVCTSDRYAIVTGATDDGGQHYGMGNHVMVRHVACEERCGSLDETLEDGQHLFLLEGNSTECVLPTPTPPPGGDVGPVIEPEYEDLVLDCRESGWKASYFHLWKVNVSVGDLVERGEVLGWIDNTGNSTGTHLHYQINGPEVGAIDPAPAMCDSYDPGLRTTWQWERGVCEDIGGE